MPNQEKLSFLQTLKFSIIIGVFPTLVYIYLDEKYHHNKYKTASKELTEERKEVIISKPKRKSTKKVTIYASNNKDNLSFKINTLIYVTSESNYACFFIKNDENIIKEYILRLPLKDVEAQLKEFSEIFRCHKSYLINTSYINEVSGNARGYYFHMNNIKIDIPVSRSINKKQLQGKIFLSL